MSRVVFVHGHMSLMSQHKRKTSVVTSVQREWRDGECGQFWWLCRAHKGGFRGADNLY